MLTIKRRVRFGNRNRDYSYIISPGHFRRGISEKRGYSWANKSFSQAQGRPLITFPSRKAAEQKVKELSRADLRQYDYTIEKLTL